MLKKELRQMKNQAIKDIKNTSVQIAIEVCRKTSSKILWTKA